MPLPSIRDIIKRGSVFENNIDDLLERTEDDSERAQRVANILSWLQECVDHGKYLPELSPDRRALQGQVDYWTSILGQNGIVVDIDRLAPFDPAAGVPLEVACPYPGLQAYDENRQTDFIGREKDTEYCVTHLEANPILMIVGGSGSGKSSLALAGILPRLKSAHADWQFIPPFTPGAKPFESLGKALAEALANSSDAFAIAESLRQQPGQAAVVLDKLFGAGTPVMLLIDQFEELLTLCQDGQKQEAFSELLYGLVNRSESACRILLTLRTDHLARFETNPSLRNLYGLVSNINTRQLAAIDLESIHRAIEIPAKKIGLRFLPPRIIDDLANQSAGLVDGLPLLQFALQRLWEERPPIPLGKDEKGNEIQGPPPPLPRLDFINEESFKKLPDVQSALGKVAQVVFQQFDKEKQKLCERLMLELVLLDENFEQPLRRRRSKAELLKILKLRWAEATVNEVIDDFDKQGLLHYGGDGEAQQLEVAHEAMFRNWPTFRDWISGEDAKTRLHAVKLIGREALDWRTHKESCDYLKLAGKPLKSAQDYVKDYWLMDKDSTDYVNACDEQERKIGEQRQLAEQAEILAQKAEIARIQTENEQAKAKTEKLEALRKIEQAEAIAKAQKKNTWFALAGLAFVIIAFWLYNEEQKKAALISLPLVASKLPPWESLDLTYSVVKKGGEDFRYVLAHDLERMEDRDLFSPRMSDVVIAGQGTAIFQFDNLNQKDQKLNVFRVCKDGRIDKNFAEVHYKERQLVTQYVDIAPPNNQPGENDNRLIILPFKKDTPQQGLNIEVYRLNWQNEPCAAVSESEKPQVDLQESATKSLDDVDDISAMTFSASGNNVAFSAISYPRSQAETPSSTVWTLNGIDRSWKPVSIEATALTEEQRRENENVISAVAFTEGEPGLSPEQLLITGRLNGAIYCGNKRFEKYLDGSPVRQIVSNHSKFATESEPWFVYRHESGKVIARQCNSTKEQEKSFTEGKKENISFISINYIPAGVNKQIKPVVTYVNDKQPSCWIKEQEWMPFNCNSTHLIEQFVIAADAKHLITIEPGGEKTKAAVHNFSQEFSDVHKQWVGKLSSGEFSIVWPKGVAENRSENEILKAAISPSGNYIARLERKSNASEIDLRIIKENKDTKVFQQLLNFEKDKINTFDLAVTDNGSIVLAINDKLRLFKLKGKTLKEDPLPSGQAESRQDVDPNISCLEVSPDNTKLVIGTKGGRLRLFNLTKGSFEISKPEESEYISDGSSKGFVSACAVDNTGMRVGGLGDGSVRVVKADSSFKLWPSAIYQFMEPVKAVSIDSQQGYVAALFDWQTRECTAIGLQGQSIRIWGDLKNREKSPLISNHWVPSWLVSMFENGEQFPLISNSCFPNRYVMTIGSITEQNSKLFLRIVDDSSGVKLIPCRGCANKSEEPADVWKRLLKEAKDKKAQIITDKDLEERYGIKF